MHSDNTRMNKLLELVTEQYQARHWDYIKFEWKDKDRQWGNIDKDAVLKREKKNVL